MNIYEGEYIFADVFNPYGIACVLIGYKIFRLHKCICLFVIFAWHWLFTTPLIITPVLKAVNEQ